MGWRDHLKVHPAAELFPLMSPDELRELANDIRAHGLRTPAVLQYPGGTPVLVDGRNRLDALALLGAEVAPNNSAIFEHIPDDADPYTVVISANVHRRHLTAEQKREVIAKLLKATLERSNRHLAKVLKVDDKTVASVRREMEGRAEIPHVAMRTDSKGRQQLARKPPPRTRTKLKNPTPPLNSLSWSEAGPEVRRKFVDAVCLKALWDAASPDQRAALREHIHENERRNDIVISAAAATAAPESDDPFAIPTFLQRKRRERAE
jgi:hypothetical protein